MEKMKKKVFAVRIAYLSPVGSLCFFFFTLDFKEKDNFIIFMTKSLFPSQRPILLYFWEDNLMIVTIISFLFFSKTNSSLPRINFPRGKGLGNPWINTYYVISALVYLSGMNFPNTI